MKKIVYRYSVSKYRRFTSGLLFAVITIIALLLCFSIIANNSSPRSEIILPFMVAIISLLLGFISMFRQKEIRQEKV